MGYIEQTDVGNVYITDINDWFATLSNLNRECKNYIDSEIRYKEILTEHDKRIRAEIVEEVKGLAQHYLIGFMDLENATKYGNKNAKQQDISYGTLMRYEIADCVDDFIDNVERLTKGE